jgi:hypothetical protein
MARKTAASPGLLFNLKEWLTLEDSARHLSIVFGETVAVADVLHLAIDKRLTLSVDFVNHGTVRKGRLVPLSECKFSIFSTSFPKPGEAMSFTRLNNLSYSDIDDLPKATLDLIKSGELILAPEALSYRPPDEFLVLEDEIKSISGVWDLPMMGGEALDVEHKYQMETNGPEVTLTNLEGAFVERDGVICQLQEDFDNNEYTPGGKASLVKLKEHIRENDLPKEKADELLNQHAEQRKKFLEKGNPPIFSRRGKWS